MQGAERPAPQAPQRVDPRRVIVDAVRFRNEQDRLPEPVSGSIARLVGRHVVRPEKSGPALSFARYASGAQRGKAGVLALTALVFDYDHLAAEEARGVVGALRQHGLSYLLYSSFSHGVGGPDDCCFRVVLPVSRPIPPDEVLHTWAAVDQALGGHADPRARDLARLWYLPACPPERQGLAVLDLQVGHPVDVDMALDHRAPPTPSPPSRARPTLRVRPGRALQVARRRLNTDPAVRQEAAVRLQAQLTETRATHITCPSCGRPSAWFWLDPSVRRTASCNHRKTCGWWGFLDTLLASGAGGGDGR